MSLINSSFRSKQNNSSRSSRKQNKIWDNVDKSHMSSHKVSDFDRDSHNHNDTRKESIFGSKDHTIIKE